MLRSVLFSHFDERHETIALTHALTVARIARSDYPRFWPSMLEQLALCVSDTANELVQLRAARALACTVKALCNHETASTGWRGDESAGAIFALADQMTAHCGDTLVASLERRCLPDGRVVQLHASGSKVARRLLAFAPTLVHAQAASLLGGEPLRIARLAELAVVLRGDSSAAEHDTALHALVLQLKLPEQMLQRGVADERMAGAVVPYVPVCAQLLSVCDPVNEDSVPIAALKLLSAVLGCAAVRAAPAMAPLWEAERVCALLELLVERYFVLRDSELQDWASDGEAFFLEQDLDMWQGTPRALAKGFALESIQAIDGLPALVAQMLMRRIAAADAARQSDATRLEGARLLDACYALCGIAAFELHEHVPFASWFGERFAPELSALIERAPTGGDDPFAPLMQRRVLWLLTMWLNDVPATIRPQVCRLLASVVAAPQADLVVRLTAVSTLHTFVVDSVTSRDAFLPLLHAVRDSIVGLMREVRELDTKRGLLEFLNAIIFRYGQYMQDAEMAGIVDLLSELWSDSAPRAARAALTQSGRSSWQQTETADQLLRNEIVGSMSSMVSAVVAARRSVVPLYGAVVPLIRFALAEADSGEDLLLEHALPLWDATVSAIASPDGAEPICELYDALLTRMTRSTEHLDLTIRLLAAYWRAPTVLPAGDRFAAAASEPTARLLASLLGDVRDDALELVGDACDAFLQRCMMDDGAAQHCTVLLDRALTLLFGADESELSKCLYASIWMRALLERAEWTCALLDARQATAPVSLLGTLIDVAADGADYLTTRQSKLAALAAGAALQTGRAAAVERVALALNMCIEVTLTMADAPYNEFDYAAAAENANMWLFARDAVNVLQPAQVLRETLERLQASECGASLSAALSTVDEHLLRQFEQLPQQ
jgi:hypothetical protein